MPKFDFDPDLIVSIVLGDLSPTDCPGIKITAIYQYDIFKEDAVLGIEVLVDAVNQRFITREVLPRIVMASIESDLDRMIWGIYHNLARKLSFKLFEYDPRIGLPLSIKFPDCPLFDPPYIVVPYQNYLGGGPKPQGKVSNSTNITKYNDVSNTLTTCPFCQGRIHPFEGGIYPGVWCGGNVGFAHEDCAPWVVPRH